MMSKAKWFLLPLFVCIIVAAYFIYQHKTVQHWQKLRVGNMVQAIYGLGTVHSDQVYNLSVGVTNFVKTIFVETGDYVNKGEKLVQYNDGHYVLAPFSGTITSRPFFSNQVANPQATILTLTNLKRRYLLVNMDQDSLLNIGKSKQAIISFEAMPKQKFYGKIESIYSHEGNFFIRITAPDLPEKILPGMTADVAIITKTHADTLQVPVQSVKQGKITYKVADQIKTVAVKIGSVTDGWGQLLSDNIPKNAEVLLRV
ncbi:MAG: HlyD family efflux transporter periplasmic adaptor subunit [Pseudomonadota bacterium]